MVSTPASPRGPAADEHVIERRVSLSRGPALIVGTILLAAGLYFLYKQHHFPPLGSFPNGRAPVDGHVFLGIFGANGWTGMGTAIAGGMLLFGAAEHHLAKAMSLVVGAVDRDRVGGQRADPGAERTGTGEASQRRGSRNATRRSWAVWDRLEVAGGEIVIAVRQLPSVGGRRLTRESRAAVPARAA
jgi:hypothetical protein